MRPNTSRPSGASPRIRTGSRRPGSATVVTVRRSPTCMTPRRPSPAGRSRAMEAILRGDPSTPSTRAVACTTRMRARAAGFCIYNDPALAIARARGDGLRVMYIDLDVHHGDGVQALFWDDPRRPDVLDPRDAAGTCSRGRATPDEVGGRGRSRDRGQRAARPGDRRTRLARDAVGRSSRISPRPSGPTSSCRSTAPTRTPGIRSPTCALRPPPTARPRGSSMRSPTATRAVAGWRRVAVGTTPIAWCREHGRSPGWQVRTARRRSSTPAAWRDRWAGEAARFGQAPLPEHSTTSPNAGFEVDATRKPPRNALWRRRPWCGARSCPSWPAPDGERILPRSRSATWSTSGWRRQSPRWRRDSWLPLARRGGVDRRGAGWRSRSWTSRFRASLEANRVGLPSPCCGADRRRPASRGDPVDVDPLRGAGHATGRRPAGRPSDRAAGRAAAGWMRPCPPAVPRLQPRHERGGRRDCTGWSSGAPSQPGPRR